jgi:hypothetical protein
MHEEQVAVGMLYRNCRHYHSDRGGIASVAAVTQRDKY